MDLLESYQDMIQVHKSVRDLKPGDKVCVNVPKGTFLDYYKGATSGVYTFLSLEVYPRDASCTKCSTSVDGMAFAVHASLGDKKTCTCNAYVYAEDGTRFREDFPYYEQHPYYTEE